MKSIRIVAILVSILIFAVAVAAIATTNAQPLNAMVIAATLIGGALAATALRRSGSAIVDAGRSLLGLLGSRLDVPRPLVSFVRANGLAAIDRTDLKNTFVSRGVRLCMDAHSPHWIRRELRHEINVAMSYNDAAARTLSAYARLVVVGSAALLLIGTTLEAVAVAQSLEFLSQSSAMYSLHAGGETLVGAALITLTLGAGVFPALGDALQRNRAKTRRHEGDILGTVENIHRAAAQHKRDRQLGHAK